MARTITTIIMRISITPKTTAAISASESASLSEINHIHNT
jgi:hypothetical protein